MTRQNSIRGKRLFERISHLESLLNSQNTETAVFNENEYLKELARLYKLSSARYWRKSDSVYRMIENVCGATTKAGQVLERLGESSEAARFYALVSRKFRDYPFGGKEHSSYLIGAECETSHKAYNLLIKKINEQARAGNYSGAAGTLNDEIKVCRIMGGSWVGEISSLKILKAEMLQKAGKTEEAKRIYERLARDYGKEGHREKDASEMWEKAGNLKKAAEVLENSRDWRSLRLVEAAELRERAGDYEKAIEDYRQVHYWGYGSAPYELKYAHQDKIVDMLKRTGQIKRAIEYLENSASEVIRDSWAYDRAAELRERAEKLRVLLK
jgi:tetratricopeptide (TPR) repeat protein